jgi:hypothetical protein
MKTNKKYIYWAIALVGIYLLYRWWSKRNGNGGSPLSMAGAGIIGGSNNVVPPVESQSGSNTDTTIARSIMPIFESTEQRVSRANAMDVSLGGSLGGNQRAVWCEHKSNPQEAVLCTNKQASTKPF